MLQIKRSVSADYSQGVWKVLSFLKSVMMNLLEKTKYRSLIKKSMMQCLEDLPEREENGKEAKEGIENGSQDFGCAKGDKETQTSSVNSWWLKSHFVEYGVVVDSKGNAVHEILVVSMLAPWSYRRAYVIELQCHNSKVCLYCVLRTCVDIGAILVEPGHKLKIRTPIDSESSFTFWLDMRCMFQESLDFMCVLNGCLELMQAENVEKLISAKSSSPADAALEGIHTSFCPPFKG
ncbi:unnamed protein product [Brassica rapa]|uniref:GTP-binding protein TrmE N-terminal domain-containing protein n=2 Tax=Brassica campestris TaxID=3711 RepID=A0A8D9CYQ5_BRACM|nr:unnamed protein product [Brassica rapa]